MLNNRVSKAVRLAIAFGAASSATFAGQVMAAGEEGADKVERIEVTGSRIKRTDLETAVPVTSIGKAEIGDTGTLNIQDILSRSPIALAGSDQTSSAFTTTTVGLNTTELRGLEEERTLILVNGRRFVSGMIPSAGYAVDLNAIPARLIERIDVLKSASSAIYGSDAVAGVVNIILRDDIEGVEVSGQTGLTDRGDREKHSLNVTLGNTWDSGNAWISMGYDTDKGIKSVDRSFSARDIRATDDGIEVSNSSYPPGARINGYNGDGTPYETATNSFNRSAYRQLATPLERKYISGSLNIEVSDNVTAFAEFQWNNAATDGSTIEPVPMNVTSDIWKTDVGSQTLGMSIDSPLVPDLLRTNLRKDGIENLNETLFVRRLAEFGPRDTSLERDTTRVATGFTWDLDGNWALDTYATYGQTTQTQQNGGQMNVERARFALDVEEVDGVIRCKDEQARLQGCVPLNLFGVNSVSPEALAYVTSPAKVYGKVEQSVVSSVISGELPLELEGGLLAMAAGVEYRYEKGVAQPGDLAQVGAASTNKSAATAGSFSATDVFVEFSMPVLENVRIDLAARASDHSVVGDTFTYNIGAEFRATDTLMLRTSYATAVRTPNVADLYGGRGETFASVTAPCDGLKADGTGLENATVAANCMKDPAVAARIQKEGIFELSLFEIQGVGGTLGGSPDVKEETADTFSIGAVWQATDELSFTVDYFDVKIEDAITQLSRTTVITRCYESTDFTVGCNGSYVRNPSTGALTEVHTSSTNENTIEVSGVDLEVDYRIDTDYGTFGSQLIYTYTEEWKTTSQNTGASEENVGEVETPKHRFNLNLTYGYEDINARWRARYWDSVVDTNQTQRLPDAYHNIDSVMYHDASIGYSLFDDTKFTFGINNVFDKKPPLLPRGVSAMTTANTNSRAYDIAGRAYFLNFETKF
ncbi:TonB-dependent receptor [Pseudoalteromonas luteoviolacea]|uniref:TonB-dependent receptor domain-containing protein n=1 Tax=Pseudoalteromonas luteoviolacea TaxID=43657 RepID=UPI001B35B4FC|nr:TonB-dependent receptor [Pseudoalteromonas luteoviolacea]MBQ4812275.1 TonB-dependent receptor [Pseudoalteromonas luteoviolacea]